MKVSELPTRGPWTFEVEKQSGPSLASKTWLFGSGDVIGTIYESAEQGNAQANARLIAAAPTIAEMAMAFTLIVEAYVRDDTAAPVSESTLADALYALCSCIVKATGVKS